MSNRKILPVTQYFKDKKRLIDFVLVYKTSNNDEKRTVYLDNLLKKKVEIELEKSLINPSLVYIKLHAPHNILLDYAELYDIPIKFQQKIFFTEPIPKFNCMRTKITDPDKFSDIYKRSWQTLPDNKPTDFSTHERSLILAYILKRTQYGNDPFEIGLAHLLHCKVFIAAYPLHDSKWEWTDGEGQLTDRQLLAKYWANMRMWNKAQPIDLIEKYFGVEVAFYFAWLGFYQKMLIFSSLMGVIVTLFGLSTLLQNEIAPVKEACSSNISLCPTCSFCDADKLSDYCTNFKIAYVIDNPATITFAFAMAFWSTIYMELWKRRQSVLSLRWNLIRSQFEEDIRPEYKAMAKMIIINETGSRELYVPFCQQVCRITFTLTVIFFLVLLVLSAVFGICIYELTMNRLMKFTDKTIVTVITSSIITLIAIMFLKYIYDSISLWLTNLEILRTQRDFDNSFILKTFAFSFVNYYGALIYVAFFKGKFFTYPGDTDMYEEERYVATDICDPSGCTADVFILMAVIMVLKPIFGNIWEYLEPVVQLWCRRNKEQLRPELLPRWEEDFFLNQTDHFHLVCEYEEMVCQYGFCTLFAVAFPLSPLFALLNNIFEIRIDADKLLKKYQRPKGWLVAGIGTWYDIMKILTFLAVVTNAFFITFASDFIPKAVYQFQNNNTLKGYVNWTLSEYVVTKRNWKNVDLDRCWYSGYRYPPGHNMEYKLSHNFYYLLAIRLAFVIIFEHLILALTAIVAYAIPDIPNSVKAIISSEEKEMRQKRLKKSDKKRKYTE